MPSHPMSNVVVLKCEAKENTKKNVGIICFDERQPRKKSEIFQLKMSQVSLRGKIKAVEAHLKESLVSCRKCSIKEKRRSIALMVTIAVIFSCLSKSKKHLNAFFVAGETHLNGISSSRVRRRDKLLLWYFSNVTILPRKDFYIDATWRWSRVYRDEVWTSLVVDYVAEIIML